MLLSAWPICLNRPNHPAAARKGPCPSGGQVFRPLLSAGCRSKILRQSPTKSSRRPETRQCPASPSHRRPSKRKKKRRRTRSAEPAKQPRRRISRNSDTSRLRLLSRLPRAAPPPTKPPSRSSRDEGIHYLSPTLDRHVNRRPRSSRRINDDPSSVIHSQGPGQWRQTSQLDEKPQPHVQFARRRQWTR